MNLIQALRRRDYRPKTLLDIGANVGQFTGEFLDAFPLCTPTLIEPNPNAFKWIPEIYRRYMFAASDKDGCAKLNITKEWRETTGASLYRENTPWFRDEVLETVEVKTARIDSFFPEKRFDFIKIDTQGSELDVLQGGERVVKQADYVLLEIPVVEYNIGAPSAEAVFSKIESMGFCPCEVIEFHRLKDFRNGELLQIDFLFANYERGMR